MNQSLVYKYRINILRLMQKQSTRGEWATGAEGWRKTDHLSRLDDSAGVGLAVAPLMVTCTLVPDVGPELGRLPQPTVGYRVTQGVERQVVIVVTARVCHLAQAGELAPDKAELANLVGRRCA